MLARFCGGHITGSLASDAGEGMGMVTEVTEAGTVMAQSSIGIVLTQGYTCDKIA